MDGIGHLFIADTCNNLIREVNLNYGIITTIAGDGHDAATRPARAGSRPTKAITAPPLPPS